MSSTTTHYSLVKPEITDTPSNTIPALSNNFDDIDDELYLAELHRASSTAHAAQNITYTGDVTGRTEVKGAIDDLQVQVDAIVVGSGTSPAEVTSARESIRGETNATLNDRLDKAESNQGQITSVSSSKTLATSERGLILVDTSGGDVTLGLPSIASNTSLVLIYLIKKTTADAYSVIVDPDSTDTVDGASTFTLSNQYDYIKIINSNSEWVICEIVDKNPAFDELVLEGTNPSIYTDTADASDNKKLTLSGGGGITTARSGIVELSGNEETAAGTIAVKAGNVSGGDIDFYTQDTLRASIAYDGNFNVANLTADRVVITDGSKNLASSSVTSTVLSYLDIGSSLTTLLAGKEASFTKGDLTETTSSVLTISNGTGRLYGATGLTIQVKEANTGQSGYITSTDWNTFNNKEPAFSKGDLTETTSSVLTISNGTGRLYGATGLTIQVKEANTGQSGYLTSTDWNTFNGKEDGFSKGDLTETTSSILTISNGTGRLYGATGLTIAVQEADTSNSGYITSTDWNIFNNKQDSLDFTDLAGTTDQINLSASGTNIILGSTPITLSLPQSIAATNSPQFAGMGLGLSGIDGSLYIAQAATPVAFGEADKIGIYATDGADCTFGLCTEALVSNGLIPMHINGIAYDIPVIDRNIIHSSFVSPGESGSFYCFGYFDFPATSVTLTQASTTQAYGTANAAYGAKAFIVASGAGTASGVVSLKVVGTSISYDGTRVAADEEILIADIRNLTANQQIQTTKMWIGQITFTLVPGAETASVAFNYGLVTTNDFFNSKVNLKEFEIIGRAGADDTGFDVEVIHYIPNDSGWTYSASAFTSGGNVLAKWTTDHSTETNLSNGEYFHWHRSIDEIIDGTVDESLLIKITTGANSAVESSELRAYYERIT